MGLSCDFGHKLEIGVVVQNGQLARLSHCCDQGINQRKRPMVAPFSKLPLNADRPLVIAVGNRHRVECIKSGHDRLVIGRVSGAEPELEDHRRAQCNTPLGNERSDSGGDHRLR